MATSGSIDFTVTTEEIIQESLFYLGVLGEGESPNTTQINENTRTLNLMAKNWQARGLNLFAVQRVYVFLNKEKIEYKLGSTGDQLTTDFVETEYSGDNSGTNITVLSTEGMTAGDFFGGQIDNLDMHYTTVASVDSDTTLTLTEGLPSTGPDGGFVITYTKKANRPMKLVNCVIRERRSKTDTPIDIIDRTDYVDLSNKTTSGRINQVYYDPQINTGTMFVWPTTDDATNYIVLRVQRTLEDFDAVDNTPDYPQEWFLPLSYGLAHTNLPKYAVDRDRARIITNGYALHLGEAEGFDSEDYVHLRPDDRWASMDEQY